MSDLIERLRQPWPPSHSEDPLMTEAADTIAALIVRVEQLEKALRDLVRLVDEDEEEVVPPYLVDQVLDRARAAITQGERKG